MDRTLNRTYKLTVSHERKGQEETNDRPYDCLEKRYWLLHNSYLPNAPEDFWVRLQSSLIQTAFLVPGRSHFKRRRRGLGV